MNRFCRYAANLISMDSFRKGNSMENDSADIGSD